MLHYRIFIVLALCALWQAPAWSGSGTLDQRVRAAIEKLDATDLDADWYFTMVVTDGEDVRVIESDPTREPYERRQLVSVNDAQPDADALQAFRKEEKKRIDDIDPDTADYRYLVDLETLSRDGEGDGQTRYTFAPRVKDMEKSREHLLGTLLLNGETGQIDQLVIENTEQLAPAFSVTVDTYRLGLSFAARQGEQLLQGIESKAVGKAGFLKSFDSDVTVAFRDYRRAP